MPATEATHYLSGKELFTGVIGARAAVKLSRNLGGAGVYVPAAQPNYAEIKPHEKQAIGLLHLQGYYNREIAAMTGRSVSSIGPIISCLRFNGGGFRRLPKPQSSEGKIIRAALRRGESVTIYGRTYSPPEVR